MAAVHIVIWLLIAATLSRCTLPAVTRDISDIERILHKRNAAVLEQAQLSSPGTSLQLIEKDHDDSIYLASYQWTIESYEKRQERRLDSSVFRAAATLWQLILYPHGDGEGRGHVSLYIGATLAPHWGPSEAVHCSWRFSVVNARDKRPNTVHDVQHNFTRFSTNWGFNRLTLRSVLLDPEEGWLDRAGGLLLRVDVLQVVPYWTDYAGIERQHYDTVRSSVALWNEMQGLGLRDLMVTYSITDDGHSRVGYSLQGHFYSSAEELRAALAAQSESLRSFFASSAAAAGGQGAGPGTAAGTGGVLPAGDGAGSGGGGISLARAGRPWPLVRAGGEAVARWCSGLLGAARGATALLVGLRPGEERSGQPDEGEPEMDSSDDGGGVGSSLQACIGSGADASSLACSGRKAGDGCRADQAGGGGRSEAGPASQPATAGFGACAGVELGPGSKPGRGPTSAKCAASKPQCICAAACPAEAQCGAAATHVSQACGAQAKRRAPRAQPAGEAQAEQQQCRPARAEEQQCRPPPADQPQCQAPQEWAWGGGEGDGSRAGALGLPGQSGQQQQQLGSKEVCLLLALVLVMYVVGVRRWRQRLQRWQRGVTQWRHAWRERSGPAAGGLKARADVAGAAQGSLAQQQQQQQQQQGKAGSKVPSGAKSSKKPQAPGSGANKPRIRGSPNSSTRGASRLPTEPAASGTSLSASSATKATSLATVNPGQQSAGDAARHLPWSLVRWLWRLRQGYQQPDPGSLGAASCPTSLPSCAAVPPAALPSPAPKAPSTMKSSSITASQLPGSSSPDQKPSAGPRSSSTGFDQARPSQGLEALRYTAPQTALNQLAHPAPEGQADCAHASSDTHVPTGKCKSPASGGGQTELPRLSQDGSAGIPPAVAPEPAAAAAAVALETGQRPTPRLTRAPSDRLTPRDEEVQYIPPHALAGALATACMAPGSPPPAAAFSSLRATAAWTPPGGSASFSAAAPPPPGYFAAALAARSNSSGGSATAPAGRTLAFDTLRSAPMSIPSSQQLQQQQQHGSVGMGTLLGLQHQLPRSGACGQLEVAVTQEEEIAGLEADDGAGMDSDGCLPARVANSLLDAAAADDDRRELMLRRSLCGTGHVSWAADESSLGGPATTPAPAGQPAKAIAAVCAGQAASEARPAGKGKGRGKGKGKGKSAQRTVCDASAASLVLAPAANGGAEQGPPNAAPSPLHPSSRPLSRSSSISSDRAPAAVAPGAEGPARRASLVTPALVRGGAPAAASSRGLVGDVQRSIARSLATALVSVARVLLELAAYLMEDDEVQGQGHNSQQLGGMGQPAAVAAAGLGNGSRTDDVAAEVAAVASSTVPQLDGCSLIPMGKTGTGTDGTFTCGPQRRHSSSSGSSAAPSDAAAFSGSTTISATTSGSSSRSSRRASSGSAACRPGPVATAAGRAAVLPNTKAPEGEPRTIEPVAQGVAADAAAPAPSRRGSTGDLTPSTTAYSVAARPRLPSSLTRIIATSSGAEPSAPGTPTAAASSLPPDPAPLALGGLPEASALPLPGPSHAASMRLDMPVLPPTTSSAAPISMSIARPLAPGPLGLAAPTQCSGSAGSAAGWEPWSSGGGISLGVGVGAGLAACLDTDVRPAVGLWPGAGLNLWGLGYGGSGGSFLALGSSAAGPMGADPAVGPRGSSAVLLGPGTLAVESQLRPAVAGAAPAMALQRSGQSGTDRVGAGRRTG